MTIKPNIELIHRLNAIFLHLRSQIEEILTILSGGLGALGNQETVLSL